MSAPSRRLAVAALLCLAVPAAEGFTIQTMAEAAGEHLLIAGSRSVPQPHVLERHHFLAAIGPDGRQTVRYVEQVSEIQRPDSVVLETDFLPCFALANALGPDGRLWGQHSRSNQDLPAGVFQRLDLYDPDGVWRREVDVVCEGNAVSDGLRFLDDGRVVLIKGFVTARLACLGTGAGTIGEDDTDVVEIVCYRLPEVE